MTTTNLIAKRPRPEFSKQLPSAQLQVNSSSLGPFKVCPRKYEYEVLRGLTSGDTLSVHLTFGTLVHEGLERYEKLRQNGGEHEEALRAVVAEALEKTWNSKLGRAWISGHADKNRLSLIRSLVWYLDKWNEDGENYETLVLKDGSPAVELKFEFDSGWRSPVTGERVSFYGSLDRIVLVKSLEKKYILDTKTTGYGVKYQGFAEKFTPDNQFSLYALAGRVAFGEEVEGVVLDGVEVKASVTNFARTIVGRTERQLQEWLRDSHWWLTQMHRCAEEGYWPQNDKSCGMYGGCEWRGICSEPDGLLREAALRARTTRS